MEPDEISYIQQHLDQLLDSTDCNTSFLAFLVAHDVLSKNDTDEVELQHLPVNKAKRLYEKLYHRTGSYNKLLHALRKTKQTGAASVLEAFYGTDPENSFFIGLENSGVTLRNGRASQSQFSELELRRQLEMAYRRRHSDALLANNFNTKCELEYDTCVKMYKAEMRKIMQERKISQDEDDLASYHKLICNILLTQFDSKLTNNTDNAVPLTIVADFKRKLEQKLEEIYSEFHHQWEESRQIIAMQVDFFLFKTCIKIGQDLKENLSSSTTRENAKNAFQSSVETAKKQFRSTFRQINDEYLNTCLEELTTSANKTFVDQTKEQEHIAGLTAELKTGQLAKDYENEMKTAISLNPFLEGDELQVFSAATRISTLEKYEKFEKTTKFAKKYKDRLELEMNQCCEFIKQEQQFKIERYLAEAKLVSSNLTLMHSGNLKEKAYEMKTGKELEAFHNKACEEILLKTFQEKCPQIAVSSRYEKLVAELAEELKNEYAKIYAHWDEKIAKTFHQIKKTYDEELERQVRQTHENSSAPPKVSQSLHETACQAALSKCIPQTPASASTRLLSESKLLLDSNYQQQIVIGIDFGTEYCNAAVHLNGKIVKVPHFDNSGSTFEAMASYVGVEEYDGLVGQCAQAIIRESENQPPVIYDMKDVLFNCKNLQWGWHRYNLPFTYKDGPNGPMVTRGRFEYSLNTLLAKLFGKLRKNAEEFLSRPVQNCVVTLPIFFKQPERLYITEAAKMGGFRQVTIFEEVSAVVLTLQNMNNRWNNEKKVLLIDIGTAWSNMYLIEIVGKEIKLLAYVWCDGGYIFQRNLATFCVDEFCKSENVSMNELNYDNAKRRRLTETCEKAVISLTMEDEAIIALSNFYGGKELRVEVTKAKFEEANAKHFDAIASKVNEVVKAAFIEEVILYGGYSQIPKVQETVRSCFNGKQLLGFSIKPDEVLAYGAAIMGATKTPAQSQPTG